MRKLIDMVRDGQKVKFVHYRQKELWYETECGFKFPVHINDTDDAFFLPEDKALFFMKHIKKALDAIEKEKLSTEWVGRDEPFGGSDIGGRSR